MESKKGGGETSLADFAESSRGVNSYYGDCRVFYSERGDLRLFGQARLPGQNENSGRRKNAQLYSRERGFDALHRSREKRLIIRSFKQLPLSGSKSGGGDSASRGANGLGSASESKDKV